MSARVHVGWLQHLPISTYFVDIVPSAQGSWAVWPPCSPSLAILRALVEAGLAEWFAQTQCWDITDDGKRLLRRLGYVQRQLHSAQADYWTLVHHSPNGMVFKA